MEEIIIPMIDLYKKKLELKEKIMSYFTNIITIQRETRHFLSKKKIRRHLLLAKFVRLVPIHRKELVVLADNSYDKALRFRLEKFDWDLCK